eukprot:tig00020538_g10352.t1
MEVLQAAMKREAAGGECFHLQVGQPSTGAPQRVIKAAQEALVSDKIGYTPAFGIPALRERIARHYKDEYNAEVPAERIAVTTGSSAGFVLAFIAAFDAGDRVAMAAPGYPGYRNILLGLDIEPVSLLTGPEQNFQPTVELLEQAEREGGPLHGLILASPSNPTGTVIDLEHFREVVDYCTRKGIRIISDEIYHGIAYEGLHCTSAVSLDPTAVVVNSFSKFYSMTGWRIGWLVVPDDLHRSVECLQQNLFINAPTHSQLAALEAFGSKDELMGHVRRYEANRAALLRGLPAAGLVKHSDSQGAFYIYADVGDFTEDSEGFCRQLLNDTGVAITPGIDFDTSAATARSVRFSFCGSSEAVNEACTRLGAWMREKYGAERIDALAAAYAQAHRK